ncbi:MAG: hypothetical protein RBR93_08085 [Aliarcobacter butzleri]|nr:hypothetical protein [Aliarcobacter butzleri]
MKETHRTIIKDIDTKISLLKKDMLKGDFVIDKESKAILAMIKVQINELYAISRLVKEDE